MQYMQSLRERNGIKMNADQADIIDLLLAGREAEAKLMIKKVVKQNDGYQGLSKATGLCDKSLNRMLSPRGNPTSRNLFLILRNL